MKLRNQSVIFKMTLMGLSLALYIALSYASINLQFIKISMTGLPIIFIAVVYGPIEGMLVGGIGEFFCQLVSQYGLTPTTPLWVLPAIIRGLIVGLLFKQKNVKEHMKLWIFTVILCCLAVTGINTFVIWLDAKLFQYPSGLTKITFLLRFVGSIASAVLYAVIVPTLFQPLIKQGKFNIEKE